jgi:O-antigen/teichoic acid export membrane protein
LYAFATGLFSQISSLSPLSTVLSPLLPRYVDRRDVFTRYLQSAVKAQVLISIPIILASIVMLPVVAFIFPKYQPAIPLVLLMLVALIPSGVTLIQTLAFAALKEQRAYFWSFGWKTLYAAQLIAYGDSGTRRILCTRHVCHGVRAILATSARTARILA